MADALLEEKREGLLADAPALESGEYEEQVKKDEFDMGEGSLANTLEKGESGQGDPYNTFNFYYYNSKGAKSLRSVFSDGLINGKQVSELTLDEMANVSTRQSLQIQRYDNKKKEVVNEKVDGRLFAAGRFQVIPNTLKGIREKLKLDGSELYGKNIQHICFCGILNGLTAVQKYFATKNPTAKQLTAAANAIAGQWASVKTSAGVGRYDGKGNNKATISHQTVKNALKADHASLLAEGRLNLLPSIMVNSGGNSAAQPQQANANQQNQNQSENDNHRGRMVEGKLTEHIVQKGDSIWKIANMYGITTNQLLSDNGLTSKSVLKIGQKIKINN